MFMFFMLKLTILEAHLIDSKVIRMVIQLEYFFLIKSNGECQCNVKTFLFGMSPDVPALKVHVFTIAFNCELELNISSKHSNSNFSHSFVFHCLTNFAKNINLSYIDGFYLV